MNNIDSYSLKQKLNEYANKPMDSDLRSLLNYLAEKNVLIGTKKGNEEQMMIIEDEVSHTGFYLPVFTEIDEIPDKMSNCFDWYAIPLNVLFSLMSDANAPDYLDVEGIIINPNTHNIVVNSFIIKTSITQTN